MLGASKNAWLRYSDEELIQKTYISGYATQLGSAIHELAAQLIDEKIKLSKSDKKILIHHLNQSHIPRNVYDIDYIFCNFMNYVNDAIGYRMQPEQVLYYSDLAYGTADAISFRNGELRIHDLKTGTTPAHMEQLEIYAALFCLENNIKPDKINIELCIYQGNQVPIHNPDPNDILAIMDRIVEADKILMSVKEQ